MRMASCFAGSGFGFVTLVPLLRCGRSCSGASRRQSQTFRKSLVERRNQLRVAGLALQTAIDLDASDLKKTHEPVEARPHIGFLQSFQRAGKKTTRCGIYLRIKPRREARWLPAFLHIAAALVLRACQPFGICNGFVAITALLADGHTRSAQ